MPELSVFFPAFNEQENIAELLKEAVTELEGVTADFELIVVDDGSTDATARMVSETAEKDARIRLVSHPSNAGYGAALRTGFETSTGDYVFFTDADRQFRLSDISKLWPIRATDKLVIGYRIKRNDPWHRLVVAKVYHFVLWVTFGLHVTDVDCAFKLLGRRALDAVLPNLTSRSAFISPETLIRAGSAGFAIEEVGVDHYPRAAGKPKGATPKVILRTIREIIAFRRGFSGRV